MLILPEQNQNLCCEKGPILRGNIILLAEKVWDTDAISGQIMSTSV